MRTLFNALSQQRVLADQSQQIAMLTREVEKLRSENERLKAAARRCVPCEYRLEIRRQRSEHKLLGRIAANGEDDSEEE